jgi:hypothetical protein
VTAQGFEALMTAVGPCEIGSLGLDRSCGAYQAFQEAKRQRGPIERPWRDVDRALAIEHLAHEDAAVRFVAADLLGPALHGSTEMLEALVEATRREIHPGVVKHFIRRLGPSTYHNEAVRGLILALADHLDVRVRMEVAAWLTNARGRGTPQILARAMKMVEDDPAEQVRLRALDDLGDQGDETVLPFLEPYLAATSKSERAHASAVRALVTMWSSPAPQPTPREAAYERTMALLEKTPRSETSPPWKGLSGLRWTTNPRFVARAPWFDATRMRSALEAIFLDPAVGWRTGKAMVDIMSSLQVERAHFERLLDTCTRKDHGIDPRLIELLRATIDPPADTKPPATPATLLPIPAPKEPAKTP